MANKGAQLRLRQLLDFHQSKVSALTEVLGMLNDDLTTTKQKRAKSVIEQALDLDNVRRLKAGGKTRGRKKPVNKASKQLGRERTQAFLAVLPTTPITLAELKEKHPDLEGLGAGIGPLLRHGYIKRVKGKYARTKKPFTVEAETASH